MKYLFNLANRKKYTLSDGSEMNVFEVMIKYERIWNEPMSESLAFVRLTYTTDPHYIFSKKGMYVGHEYCKIAKIKRIAAQPKKKRKIPDERLQSMEWYSNGTKRQFYDPMWKLIMKNI
jgi:hypothetical protein